MDRYANEDLPKDIPTKLPHPSYAVIARLVLLDGSEEWRPAWVVRWTPSSHVLVKLQEQEGIEPGYVWLRGDDVRRLIRPSLPGSPSPAPGRGDA